MPSFDIDFSVYCTYGKGLCDNSDTGTRNGYLQLIVGPCPNCLADANSEGYAKGYDDRKKEEEEEDERAD